MYKSKKQLSIAALFLVLLLVATSASVFARPSGTGLYAVSPSLGAAASFSVLAKTGITNVPNSVFSADVGLSPAAPGGNMTGITAAQVGGTIFTTVAGGPAGSVVFPSMLTTAITNMGDAYTNLSNQGCDFDETGTGNVVLNTFYAQPLAVGVYCADSFEIIGTPTLELDPGVIVFKSSSTLTTATDSSVTSADPCNVWWRVGTNADIGVRSAFVGNILSGTAINLRTNATVVGGRLLAQSAVTLDQNTINGCAVPYGGPIPTEEPTEDATAGPEILPDTGGDQVGPESQIFQISLGALGLSLILFGVMLSRKTQKVER